MLLLTKKLIVTRIFFNQLPGPLEDEVNAHWASFTEQTPKILAQSSYRTSTLYFIVITYEIFKD